MSHLKRNAWDWATGTPHERAAMVRRHAGAFKRNCYARKSRKFFMRESICVKSMLPKLPSLSKERFRGRVAKDKQRRGPGERRACSRLRSRLGNCARRMGLRQRLGNAPRDCRQLSTDALDDFSRSPKIGAQNGSQITPLR